jgi:hypothetical protein
LQLLARRIWKSRLGQSVLAVATVGVEEATEEADHRNALKFSAPLRLRDVALGLDERLEPMRVAECLRSERSNRLAESYIGLRERMRVLFGAQSAEKDRANHRTLPPNGYHNDRSNVSHGELRLNALEHRLVRGVRDEYGLPRFESTLQLRIAVEVDDEVSDRRGLVVRYQTNLVMLS